MAASSSSSSGPGWKHGVFLNFTGKDTYTGFVGHLDKALRQKSIATFNHAEKLRKDDHLSEHVIAIRESRLMLVVFSQEYASSARCLKELVEILQCNGTEEQIMVPIFYQVDPSDVRNLRRSFAVAFARHDTERYEVRSWRSALTEAADFSGWVSRDFRDDAELIENIVEDVVGKLTDSSPASIEYDVFINFRGEDTRRGFVSHLYRALHENSINTYIDAKALRKGDPLSKLLIAARESKISIVVISANYGSSAWCLNELVEITKNQIVLPIFYKVDPSIDNKLGSSFAEAFAKHDNDSSAEMDEVRSWRSALRSATNFCGWDSQYSRNDAELIENIIEVVSRELIRIASTSSESNGLIEMDSHMDEMHLLLHPPGVEMNDVRVVGIWGTGGLGKTTIARAVYDEIADRFEAACFLENVKEGFMKLGKLHMQAQLLESILGNKGTADREGSSYISNKTFQMMLERLGKRKVLLVVDNVDKVAQIEALLGKQHSFGGGSKIIITTRDVQLLRGADAIYEPKIFSDPGALELFRWYAFRTNQPTADYDDLSRRVIQYAQGLPLALKVLGAFLYNKTVHEWEDVLEKLRKIPERKIHDVLKTSIDGLDDITKDIFLDIACFFKGMNVDSAVKIMGKSGMIGIHPGIAIRVLIDRALITVSRLGDLEMHDSLEEMGREIVRQESLKKPERQSRLRRYEDVDLESQLPLRKDAP